MIPRVFRFVFGLQPQDEPFHLLHFLCLSSCLAVNRPGRVVVHCVHVPWGPLWDRIRPSIEIAVIPHDMLIEELVYTDPKVAKYRYAHLADFVRLRLLLEHGGVYADMDTLFLRPLRVEFFAAPCVMGRESVDPFVPAGAVGGSLCNAFIMAEPGSAFIRRWLDEMPGAFDGSWSRHSTFLPYRLSQQFGDLIHVEPETSFFALDWTPSGLADLFERHVTLSEQAYSLHLWAHLWWDPARRDFSRFHAERLTTGYVHHADTTYAHFARRFMPPGRAPSKMRYRLETLYMNYRDYLSHFRH